MDESFIDLTGEHTQNYIHTFGVTFKNFATSDGLPPHSFLVDGFIFSQADCARIRVAISNPNNKLFLHLAYLDESQIQDPEADPFTFRPVLQIAPSLDASGAGVEYFEFASPCPPNCKRFIGDPLNPFDIEQPS